VRREANVHFSSINMYKRIMTVKRHSKILEMDKEAQAYFEKLYQKGKITMRSYDKIKRLAQTIAHMSSSEAITLENLLEAVMLHGDLYRH